MDAPRLRAAIPVIFATFVLTLTHGAGTNAQPRTNDNIAELWQAPDDIASRDLFNGPGGAGLKPSADTPFTWIATDTTGYSAGFDVRGADGREWSVKLGPEAQAEVVVSRILWAIGYHQPPTYYLESWELSGGPGGRQAAARFRTHVDGAEVAGDWSWTQNDFINTQPFRGLIVANILLSNWDWKTSNNKIYRHADGTRRFVVRDLGASLGKTSSSKLVWAFPMRGFGQGSRNDIEGFESQGFIEQVREGEIEFDFETIYGALVDRVRPADVKWAARLLSQITDAQWQDAFRAAEYAPDVSARFIRKIKAKIAEGLAVS
jgi:hypothetical protein